MHAFTRIGAAVSLVALTILVGVGATHAAPRVTAAPAFKARDLTALPRTNWEKP